MATPMTTFRLDKATLRMLDQLVKDPPKEAVSSERGKPRNRTELVENLVKSLAERKARSAAKRPSAGKKSA